MSAHFALSTFRFPLSVSLTVLVAGCSIPNNALTGSGSIRDLLHTASGYVMEGTRQAAATIELGKMGIEKAKQTASGFRQRIDDVQKGIEAVKEGKELIEKSIAK